MPKFLGVFCDFSSFTHLYVSSQKKLEDGKYWIRGNDTACDKFPIN